MLQTSTEDTIGLTEAIATRTQDLVGTHLRLKGVPLVPPPSMDPDFKLFNQMFDRFQEGDFRNTRDELLAARTIAQWTVDVNASLRNQSAEKIAWRD